MLLPYNRTAAVQYAHTWAFLRNPDYYNYEGIGGDCTNFASQCLYAGGGLMDYTPETGWYYLSPNRKAPAWTGVEFLYRFLLWEGKKCGPCAEEVTPWEIQPGDLVQLSFGGGQFGHTPVVVSVVGGRILVAAHTYDADWKPLDSYQYEKARYLHITGIKPRE